MLARIAEEQKITVVMVTHEPEAAKHCSKVFVVADGTMRGVIDTAEEGGMDAGSIATRTQHLLGSPE
jgi:ABC-type lipoprotein export system ATPase subunit